MSIYCLLLESIKKILYATELGPESLAVKRHFCGKKFHQMARFKSADGRLAPALECTFFEAFSVEY